MQPSFSNSFTTFLVIILGFTPSLLASSMPSTRARDTYYAAEPDSAIRLCLERMNEVLLTKDVPTVMGIFDRGDDIILIGSDSGEICIGRQQVENFFKMIVSMPFVFSFDWDHVVINHRESTAWVFVDGKMVHTSPSGKISKVPYRIAAVMVKVDAEWKWKMFSGSIPRGE